MSMMVFYPQIKSVHIAAVVCSGSLFFLRGALVQAGRQAWAMAAPLRYLSYGIDTVLLTAALMLLTILPGAMFANGWLAVKLSLLVGYVVLGVYALRRAKTQRARVLSFIGALLLFVSIYATARSHQPLGFVQWWFQ